MNRTDAATARAARSAPSNGGSPSTSSLSSNSLALDSLAPDSQPCDRLPCDRLVDDHGRTVRYLRFSVTDRCNLRCIYCRSNAMERSIPHDEVLRYEEMLRVVEAAVGSGVEKVRLTGGEPFARKGLMSFIRMLRTNFPQVDVRITTNATLIRPHVAELRELGIKVVNISLDSFRPEVFASVTGRDLLHEVRAAMDDLLAAGIRLKINAVALRGVNDGELPSFLDFARHNPVDVRFIEFMPMGADTRWSQSNFWPATDILTEAQRVVTLTPLASRSHSQGEELESPRDRSVHGGPARMYAMEGGQGRFGLITAMSNHFCGACNRLRVTSDGFLRTCLFADKEYALRGILRHPRLGVEHLRRVMALANKGKPLGEELLRARREVAVAAKRMVSIGG